MLRSLVGSEMCIRDSSAPLSELLRTPHSHLLDLNMSLLEWVGLTLLQLPKNSLVRQSTLKSTGKKSLLMAELTRAVGGTHYLSGGHEPKGEVNDGVGAAAYNEPAVFSEMCIELTYQNFTPLPYTQAQDAFIPGLSIWDALSWLGPDRVRAHLEAY